MRGRPGEIREDPVTKNLTILYENTELGKVERIDAEMTVLCTAAIPHHENGKLAKVLGIKLDEYGFFEVKDPVSTPIEMDRAGIYVCGSCHGPRDIPESVAEASAAAAKAAEACVSVSFRRDFPITAPRIGVFVCRCGINIAAYVDVPAVVEYSKTLPNVVYSEGTERKTTIAREASNFQKRKDNETGAEF